MTVQDVRPVAPSESPAQEKELQALWQRVVGRRSFLKQAGLASAAAVPVSALAAASASAKSSGPTKGDVAILRFLAAAEILETDLWEQYNELGGADGGNPAYVNAMANIDSDQPAYISGNTRDERSHADFLNAYLVSKGAPPVNLEPFRTLTGSQATGAVKGRARLTNLMELNVDTSWYLRYRSTANPDFGATFGQAVTINNQPAIPLNDEDTPPNMKQPVPPKTTQQSRMQAIANSAAFHFAMIEQGGSSLYSTLALQVTNVEVLRIVLSIGGTEVDHFGVWQDTAANAVEAPLAGIKDPETGTFFPNLKKQNRAATRPNNIFPRPSEFINHHLPHCSIVRPTLSQNGGAMAAVKFLTATGLFKGQSSAFFAAATELAQAADAAVRGL
jgi:hypothetical protein